MAELKRARPRITAALAAAMLATAVATAALVAQPSAAQAAASRSTTRIGSVPVHPCTKGARLLCGGVRVPLDYSSAASPRIHIGFQWRPADGHAVGTVLAVEGGPGYSSTGSGSLYRAMLGPLLRTRNLLLVNLRGTGSSTPVNCPGLEHAGPKQYGPRFNRLVAACGRQLNHTWHYRGGGWVHASDLFNTADSARDVAGLVRALRAGRVDLYGDSYGSWFAQVFASRYARLLRSVTLDSTYQVLGLDPWYTTTVVTARRAFDEACARSAPCAAAAGRRSWSRISRLARRLARHPVSGVSTTENGTSGRVTVTALTLVNLINNAGFDPVVYRDLDAAARALLDHGDAAPLLRLAALSVGFDDTNEPLDGFSDGLYFAVSCTDYVQLFSRDARPAARARQYAAALRREPRRTFAPFSVTQWTEMDQYTEAYSACLDWPSRVHHTPPITGRPPLVPVRLPVLILSGGLDSLTPRLDGATLVARQMGRSARLVTLANLTHVTEQDGDNACAESIYRRLVAWPAGLRRENTSCAGRVAPVHAVGAYPDQLAGMVAARPARGNRAGRTALRAVTAGLAAVGDEISRWPLLGGGVDRGLRGGRVTLAGGGTLRIRLTGVRWVTDAAINGTARWRQESGWVTARLTIRVARGPVVRMTARWRVYAEPGQRVVVTGSAERARLAAT
ncbi:MAG TPA: alpha/beta hydrolase, partial [Streptosporangiaceae bacterium]|nr:alpha/beta hydrolase [Streptosporangiaceae bacterium]